MYQSILVPVDSSETAARGVNEAIGLARALQSKLVLLHVIDALPVMVEMAATVSETQLRNALKQDAESLLGNFVELAARDGVKAEPVIREITGGGIAFAVVEEAQRHGCDLIAMGTHGRRGISHLVLGSDAEAVVKRSEVPVLLVRGKGKPG